MLYEFISDEHKDSMGQALRSGFDTFAEAVRFAECRREAGKIWEYAADPADHYQKCVRIYTH